MITWSQCHIDWADATTISRVTHESGVYIEPGPPPANGDYDRDQLLRDLDEAVKASQ
jgi:hypothetical protein